MAQSGKTWEATEVDSRPELRGEVSRSSEFQRWRAGLPTIEIDEQVFYLPWGDIPMDEDQIIYHWARSRGLLGRGV